MFCQVFNRYILSFDNTKTRDFAQKINFYNGMIAKTNVNEI